jgi:hypothetical protein
MPTVSHSGRLLAPLVHGLEDPAMTRDQLIHRLLDCLDIFIAPGSVLEHEGGHVTRSWEELYIDLHAALFAGREHCEHCLDPA